jgi:hypothetical protein
MKPRKQFLLTIGDSVNRGTPSLASKVNDVLSI